MLFTFINDKATRINVIVLSITVPFPHLSLNHGLADRLSPFHALFDINVISFIEYDKRFENKS